MNSRHALCANENIAENSVIRLRQSWHDVLWIREAVTPLTRSRPRMFIFDYEDLRPKPEKLLFLNWRK